MPDERDRSQYRSLIDAMVHECRDGQGQVFPGWVRRGVWNREALERPDDLPEEARMNAVLAHLGDSDRAVIARMVELSYEGGVNDTLRVLHDHQVPPFEDGYERAPFNDFMGRLETDWDWPT
ncbi:MAG: DUF6547 family protein [Nocardioides sp.]